MLTISGGSSAWAGGGRGGRPDVPAPDGGGAPHPWRSRSRGWPGALPSCRGGGLRTGSRPTTPPRRRQPQAAARLLLRGRDPVLRHVPHALRRDLHGPQPSARFHESIGKTKNRSTKFVNKIKLSQSIRGITRHSHREPHLPADGGSNGGSWALNRNAVAGLESGGGV
jgi:hypothetical protein